MRTLVVGGGSIGTRHIKNLMALGVAPIAVVETDEPRKRALGRELGLMVFDSMESGLMWGPDLCIIASPTHLHASQALQAAASGCHLFIEKPLSHEQAGLAELSKEISARNLISMVGCNMRFHPGPAQVKELLDKEAIGKTLFARVQTGSYLPSWRPGQDYRKSYSASAAMGGGCILDCIHEIDLTRWYLGEIIEVYCRAEHLSSLQMDVEDAAVLICKHITCRDEGGPLSEIHLDYVQRTYERNCQIVGEKGTIFWNYQDGQVRLFDAESDRYTVFSQPQDWTANQMYIDEMRYFLSCLHRSESTMLSVSDAVNLMQVIFAARSSNESGRMVKIMDMR